MGRILFQQVETDLLQELFRAGEKIFSGTKFSSENWNPESLADFFMDESSLIIAAVRDKKILGISAGRISDKKNNIVEIFHFGVAEKFSETALADDMLRFFIEKTAASGAGSVRCRLFSDEDSCFLESAGFNETGTIRIMDFKNKIISS